MDHSVDSLRGQYDYILSSTINTVAPKCLLSLYYLHRSPWYSDGLRQMKHEGSRLKCSDGSHTPKVISHDTKNLKFHFLVVMEMKKVFFFSM